MFEDFFSKGETYDPNKYLLLEGKCSFEVMAAEFGTTKNGKNAFILTLRSIDANGKVAKITLYIMSNVYGKKLMKEFLAAIGKSGLYEAGLSNKDFCQNVIGDEGKCEVIHKEVGKNDKNGNPYTVTYNNVKYFYPNKEQKVMDNKVYVTNQPKASNEDDDLPF